MVYCFAYNCTNGSSSGKSTFAFPPNTPLKRALRKRWIAAYNRKKEDIESTKNPRLCEDHFDPESFHMIPQVAREIGCRLILKPDAVPDSKLFTRVAVNLTSKPSTSEIPTTSGRKEKVLLLKSNKS